MHHIVSYIITIGIAIGSPILTTWLLYRNQKKIESENKSARLSTLLGSIKTELSVLMEREKELIGNIIEKSSEKDGAPIDIGLIKPSHAYFTVYDNSSHELIGLVGQKNKELSEKITKAYLLTKGYYDEVVYYPELVKTYINENTEEVHKNLMNYVTKDPTTGISYTTMNPVYSYYQNVIKKDRDILIPLVNDVIGEIDQFK